MEQYPSQLLTSAIDEFAKLPGIGRKTALRLTLHLLRQEPERAIHLGESLIRLRKEVRYCKCCHNLSDSELGMFFDTPKAQCTWFNYEIPTVSMAIEATRQFQGLYHVLGGLISPMDGISPQQLEIDSLVERIRQSQAEGQSPINEVILALSTTMEGDLTNGYIFRQLQRFPHLKVTTLALGVSVGDEIEYADAVTLGRSILNRTPFSLQSPTSTY